MRHDVQNLTKAYSAAVEQKGPKPAGILWPNAYDLAKRFEVLLSTINFNHYSSSNRLKLLDFGCGPGFLLDFLAQKGLLDRVDYTGVDVTETTMMHGRITWPKHRFELRDVRDQPFEVDSFDYCVACGVFTVRFDNSYAAMESFVQTSLVSLWRSVKVGLSFNVMSKHVDWERSDLFHWPLDSLMAFCKSDLSRHVSLRLDYGLWEAAAFVFKSPTCLPLRVPERWE
jgi:SAM-dependent methyltransferase